MIKIEVEDEGMRLVLQGLEKGLNDLQPVWSGPVHDIFTSMEKEVFRQEGAYGQDKWEPLNPAYAKWKQDEVGTLPIMQLHGVLLKSLTLRDSPHHVFRMGPSFAEYGTSVPYAASQHFGDSERGLKSRKLIQVTKAEAIRIADAVLAHLISMMRNRRART